MSRRGSTYGEVTMSENIYDDYLETSTVGTEFSQWKVKEFEVNYRKFFPEDKTANVLDIGIGNGEMLYCMKNWGYTNYEGIDISQSTIKACQARDLNCQLVKDTNKFLSQNPNKYAVISLIHVIEHISKEDILILIANCRKALKGNGVLIIETPNMASYDNTFMRYNDFTHVTGYTSASLAQMLNICGFKKMEIFGTNIIFLPTISNKILKVLNKIHSIIRRIERKISGLQSPTVMELFLLAVTYNESEK